MSYICIIEAGDRGISTIWAFGTMLRKGEQIPNIYATKN